MKKLLLIFAGVLFLTSCRKTNIVNPISVEDNLKISQPIGVKLVSNFVTNEVSINVKVTISQTVTIRILDISNQIVSKEEIYLNGGDNLLKLYTSALPPSAYRIGIYDRNNNLLTITDFNKL